MSISLQKIYTLWIKYFNKFISFAYLIGDLSPHFVSFSSHVNTNTHTDTQYAYGQWYIETSFALEPFNISVYAKKRVYL